MRACDGGGRIGLKENTVQASFLAAGVTLTPPVSDRRRKQRKRSVGIVTFWGGDLGMIGLGSVLVEDTSS